MISFRIKVGNKVVAKCEGPMAEAEIWPLARHYRKTSEITIQHNGSGHWKRYALLCQWPLAEVDQ